MNPRADLVGMMHNNLASHVETVQNAIHSSADMAAWINNNSVTQISTPVKANIDLLEATRAVSADWLRLAQATIEFGFGCVRALLGCRAPQEFTDLQEEFVRAGLLVLSTYAQRLRDEAALMSEEIGQKNGAELIESELIESEQLRWAA